MEDAAKMRAAVIDSYGPPDRITLRTVPRPRPKRNELLVRVQFSTVTRTDTATLRAHPFFARLATGLIKPKMQVLGIDFAGEVVALGEDVSEFGSNDRVFGLSPERFGAHAEYICVPADGAVARLPATVALEDAVVGEGAWYASGTTDELHKDQSCLIYGASGAIGTAAVQLAKLQGAQVTTVVGSRHLALAADLGADHVINYEAEDFTALPDQFDLVFDAVGKTSWFACRPLLKPGGIFSATDLGPYWSNIWLSAWHSATGRGLVRLPFPRDAAGFVTRLSSLLSDGRIKGTFDRTYPLSEIVDAFRYVESGKKTGIVRLDLRRTSMRA